MILRRKIKLDSGEIRFRLPGDRQWVSDVTVLKITTEEFESKHALRPDESGMTQPTIGFLVDLAEAFEQLGCVDCTPGMAQQIWAATVDQFSKMQKTMASRLKKVTR